MVGKNDFVCATLSKFQQFSGARSPRDTHAARCSGTSGTCRKWLRSYLHGDGLQMARDTVFRHTYLSRGG